MNAKQKALLAKIASATEMFYVDADHKDVKALLAENAIQVNHDYKNEAGMIAARVTPQESVYNLDDTSNNTEAQTEINAAQSAPRKESKSMFKIATVTPPATVLRGAVSYPFDELERGQAFFVPATPERPNPAKSLASTVTSANERHSHVIEGQTRVNRKGNEVPATEQDRKFVIRALKDGKDFGEEFAGVEGAAVYRTL